MYMRRETALMRRVGKPFKKLSEVWREFTEMKTPCQTGLDTEHVKR